MHLLNYTLLKFLVKCIKCLNLKLVSKCFNNWHLIKEIFKRSNSKRLGPIKRKIKGTLIFVVIKMKMVGDIMRNLPFQFLLGTSLKPAGTYKIENNRM